MKKKFGKNLNLNKNTVANLNQNEKKKIKGGYTIFIETCYCNTEHKSCSIINCCPPPEEGKAQADASVGC